MVTLELPWPPSQNHYWRYGVVAGRARIFLSTKAKDYRTQVLAIVAAADMTRPPMDGRLKVTIELHAPTNRKYDLDNHAKCILDALTYANLWNDDSQIDQLLIVRQPKAGKAIVHTETLDG